MESVLSSSRTSLVFSVRGPIPIQLDEHGQSAWSSGSSVLDVVFPQPETVSEIRFRNAYTARLSLLVRFDDSVQSAPQKEHLAWAAAASLSLARLRGVDTTEGIRLGKHFGGPNKSLSDWVVSIENKVLMADPHCESGSQDEIVMAASESLVPLHDITALRFLLRQPSPQWKAFSLEDIAVYRHSVLKPPSSMTIDEEESALDALRRRTQETLRGRLKADVEDGGVAEGDAVMLPATYDILSLQIS